MDARKKDSGRRPPTMKDIADELGISASTVSRILSGKIGARKGELVTKVKDAAKRLNFQTNSVARSLRTSKTQLIGIIVPNIGDDYFARVLAGIEEVANGHGYNLIICQSNESVEKEKQLIQTLSAINVEGILISPSAQTTDMEYLERAEANGIEVVIFDRVFSHTKFANIGYQDFHDAFELGTYLIKTGCERMLYVGISESLLNDGERLRGYNRALEKADLTPCDTLFVQDIFKAQERLKLGLAELPYDCIVCYNDMVAVEVLNFLEAKGKRVPQDISVCGFDNRAICEYTTPKLTSVDHSMGKMGKLAAKALFDRLIKDEEAGSVRLVGKLVVRESTR
ncbi:LacI family DNA-binding transcriptional regulator [Roseivirga pacifica]|uniref:LacI family DNA-binding transcriptional regulator n=1 Tax=Roseivirga pacifica TaxID=1267423 RepID=UPI002095D93C|nr:LacI family DNA-binding transcriptional regulator [Roseivirga pacifica]MCO6359540.1 substrate-binding domain-containing protein [Roseivirga pacifica]MCO6366910.1 substrate-binding domain-containing protein [Roseivirga pacifica]MCO6370558.1 substrate-binding domain-containing protein [Roseivirga pacifica]MCO6374567.1 substrate-binding domain-containing protein [Roseivirga pacifica]MCO6379825.1 substrate-binding domain-containing protein [Roseivirga pacifica]